MNRFNEKLEQLKTAADDQKTAYYELKATYTAKQDELTQKEYKITSLTHQNDFLEKRLHSHTVNFKESNDQLNKNKKAIEQHESHMKELTNSIETLEAKYDELLIQYNEVQEELRDINQALA